MRWTPATSRKKNLQQKPTKTDMDEHYLEQAQALQDQLVTNAIAAAAKANERPLPWIGCCRNCQEPTGPGINFCDADCCADYQARESAKKRAGR